MYPELHQVIYPCTSLSYHNTMIVALQVWSILTLLELWVILGARVPLELCRVVTYTGHQGD